METPTDITQSPPGNDPPVPEPPQKQVWLRVAGPLVIWVCALVLRIAYNIIEPHPIALLPGDAGLISPGRDQWVWLLNSLAESVTCLLVFIAASLLFGKRAGWISGFAYAVFPPSLFATRYLWDRCLDSLLAAGVLAGCAWKWRQGAWKKRNKAILLSLVLAVGTFAISQIPSLVNPDWRLLSVRDSLSSELIHYGNSLETDGWSPVPVFLVPPAVQTDQPALAGLELRKVSRLIVDGFTEFVLFFAVAGLLKARGRRFYAALGCFGAVLFHFVFVAGQPLVAQFYTAVPPLMVLAGYGVPANILKLLLSLLAVFACSRGFTFVPFILSVLPKPAYFLASWLDGILWSLTFLALIFLVPNVVRKARAIPLAVAVSSILIAICVGEPARHEFKAELEGSGSSVRQDIYLPPSAGASSFSPVSLVLVDVESRVLSPKLIVAVNGQTIIYPPAPWMQLNDSKPLTLNRLGRIAAQYDKDLRSIRQWWAFPFPTAWLKFGARNEVTISGGTPESNVRHVIYGDYTSLHAYTSTYETVLPSFSIFSFAKGFEQGRAQDARIPQPYHLLGKTENSFWYDANGWREPDLSDDPGLQAGEYRMRIVIPQQKGEDDAPSSILGPAGLAVQTPFPPVPLFDSNTARGISGADPSAMKLNKIPIQVPAILPSGSRFGFTADVIGYQPNTFGAFDIEFSGKKDNQVVNWHSLWDPAAVAATNQWLPVTVSDRIPDSILGLQDLTVTVTAMPYQSFLLETKPDQARSSSIAVRKPHLLIMPPLDIPPENERNWLIY